MSDENKSLQAADEGDEESEANTLDHAVVSSSSAVARCFTVQVTTTSGPPHAMTAGSLTVQTFSTSDDANFHSNCQSIRPYVGAHGSESSLNCACPPSMVMLNHDEHYATTADLFHRESFSRPDQSRKKPRSIIANQNVPLIARQQQRFNHGTDAFRMNQHPAASDTPTNNPRGEDEQPVSPCLILSMQSLDPIIVDPAIEAIKSHLLAEGDNDKSIAIYKVLDAQDSNCRVYRSVKAAVECLAGSTKYQGVAEKAKRIMECCGDACLEATKK